MAYQESVKRFLHFQSSFIEMTAMSTVETSPTVEPHINKHWEELHNICDLEAGPFYVPSLKAKRW